MEVGTSKTADATSPTRTAVMITPGMTSIPSPTATRLSTRAESCSPPWKRMNETPSVSRTCEPIESSGTSIQSRTEGPSERAGPEQEQHARQAEEVGERLARRGPPPA